MQRSLVLVGVAGVCLAGAVAAVSPVWALAHHTTRVAGGPSLNPPVRTWHVIAGFTQVLPPGNHSTQSVNQFYPRTLTIFAGDSVQWAVNAFNEAHTVTFAPDPVLRKLEDPQNQTMPQVVNGKKFMVFNPAVVFPSTRGPLVERDAGSAQTLLNCGIIGPGAAPGPQTCTVTFPHVGTYAYDCLLHSGIPGNADMDGVIKVIPRPQPVNHTWTVWAGTGTATDANNGFFPPNLSIHAGESVTWKAGGVHFHTVSFGIDPRKTPLLVPVGTDAHGAPILAVNPAAGAPVIPAGGTYTGGIASSGIGALPCNYLNLPGQPFLTAPFTLTFPKPGVYRYACLVHPGMVGTITVLPATAS